MERERRRRVPRGGSGARGRLGPARASPRVAAAGVGRRAAPRAAPLELEVLEGLEDVAAAEAREAGLRIVSRATGALLVSGPAERALRLRTVVAAYSVHAFAVPRPRGLLGEQHLRTLVAALPRFRSFRISAAGSDSAVFRRLAAELERRTGMAHDPGEGDLLLRVRPAGAGWEVLARRTPRPLSARSWRVADLPGALNATIAAGMARLLGVRPRDRFLNLMSGSGTLLAERLLAGRARIAVGLDSDERALAAAVANLAAAGVAAYLVRADVRRPPLDGGTFDAICADLPYGWRSGSHAENADLYRALLAAAAGVAAPGARLAVITHDIRRFEAALAEFPQWRVDRTLRVFQKGYRPRIWLLHN